MSEPERIGDILPDVMKTIDSRVQRHRQNVLAALRDYNTNRRHRSSRSRHITSRPEPMGKFPRPAPAGGGSIEVTSCDCGVLPGRTGRERSASRPRPPGA